MSGFAHIHTVITALGAVVVRLGVGLFIADRVSYGTTADDDAAT